jgi:hypothetical protein
MLKRKQFAFEVKEINAIGEFSGYGSIFDVKDSQGDIVVKGAFDRTLKDWASKSKLPKMLWQHDTHEPIGGYTTMRPDEKGLYVEGKVLVEAGATEQRAYTHLKAGTVDGLSIGYTLFPGGMEYDKGRDAFLLKDIELWELSVVTFPACAPALVDTVKAVLEGGPKEFERFLRDAGLSREQAKGLMSRGYDGIRKLREADEDVLSEAVVKQLQESINLLRR